MPNKWRGPFPWLLAAFLANVAVIAAALYALSQEAATQEKLNALAMVALAGAAVMFALSWKVVDFLVVRRIKRMAADTRALIHGSTREGIDPERYAILSPLPEAVNSLTSKLAALRKDLSDGLERATAKSEENAARLAAILNDLHEGVVVCNLRHQVVLYNSVAMDMLAEAGQLGLGRSLFETVARDAVIHMMEMLTHREELAGRGTPFLAGTADGRMLLQARMTLIRGVEGEATGYVVTMVDAGPQVAALGRRDALLRAVAEELETPLLRLRVAADNPAIVAQEAETIEKAVKRVTAGYQRALAEWWPMADLHSGDFFGLVAHRFEGDELKVSVTGLPIWLHADSHSLALAVEALIRQISERFGLAEIDLAATADDEECWLEVGWGGATAAKPALESWLSRKLPSLGGMTVRDVLIHHAGDGIRQEHRSGRSWLQLPMRKGVEVRLQSRANVLPTRPEFYDLGLLDNTRDIGERGKQPLRTLTFVVFDTETTGLQPSQGDQIVQIGAVRVVNGRILSGESFNRIVNPGRPIPLESIKFHGITDEMAKDKPPLGVVLPQFKAYASDSVLVAHNAAFDLKFLRMRERDYGCKFDNPVLDTMMLSSFLDGAEAGHSLDSICDRFGIEITDRHTALGDAIVTAAVLLRQIEMLEERGITTLDQVVKELDINIQLHQRQMSL
ncbi:MAG TPA: exonuclease domain-containing protein [Magnetospirillum sp.]|nr:exonuclease domain-containing protein [Magnetospirillum sp.]